MRALAMALPLLLLGLAGCSDPDPLPPPSVQPVVVAVAMHSGIYDPDTLSVAQGAVLRFQAHDTMHSAKSTDGTYNAGDIAMGTSKDVTLSKAGAFTFECRFHAGMVLDVQVS